jgi:hypothetical protein
MNRIFKSCLLVLLWCFCVSGAHAADPAAGKPAQTKPAAPTASPDAPVIQVPEATYDFGEAFEGVEVSHDYKVKNAGKTELQIEQVRPG